MRTFLHFVRYHVGLDQAETQTTEGERDVLHRFASGRTRAVEIGVFEGVTTRVIRDALDASATLFAIDPFFKGRLGVCWGKSIAKREASRSSGKAHLVLLEMLSHHAAREIEGTFDFIFVDGDHRWEGIHRDWSEWSRRVASGGIIALHDTRLPDKNSRVANLDSVRYFEERIRGDSRFLLLEQVDSLSVLERKGR